MSKWIPILAFLQVFGEIIWGALKGWGLILIIVLYVAIVSALLYVLYVYLFKTCLLIILIASFLAIGNWVYKDFKNFG